MTHALHTNFMCKKTAGKLLFQQSFIFFIFPLLFFFSCKTTQVENFTSPLTSDELLPFTQEEIDWQTIGDGIDFFSFSKRAGVSYTVARINLENPRLEIVTLKSSKTWQKSCSVKSFAQKNNALVAINTSPFRIKDYILPWSKGIAIGLVISEGNVLVEPNENYSALAFYRDEHSGFWSAKIFDKQTEVLQEKTAPFEASSGFWTILRDGKNSRI